MNGGSVEVVAGINLPMLIKLASVRDEETLADAVLHAQEAGRKYINVASRVLGRQVTVGWTRTTITTTAVRRPCPMAP